MAIFSDAVLALGKNGKAPSGLLESAIARAIRSYQHGGRPLFQWWNGASTTGPAVFTIARPNFLEGGGKRLRAAVHAMPTGGAPSTTSGVILNGFTNEHMPGFSTDYPEQVTPLTGLSQDPGDDVVTGTVEEVTVGTDSLHAYAGCVYEDAIPDYVPSETVDSSKFAAGRDILGVQAGSYGSNEHLVDRFDHVWRNRRPVLTWSAMAPNYAAFTASPQDYRYIFDQTVGDGGTAPAADGPAMTLPCYAAGMGRNNTVRVYVYVLAAMSGSTDDGTLGVANKDANGNMQAFQALQNPVTISGTSYAWYPSLGAFDPATAPYFLAPTGVAFDRLCIGARSEGATDVVRIKSLMMFVYPSMA
jgi:hypothetical protein